MATIAEPSNISPLPRRRIAGDESFFVGLALACLTVAVVAFAPTYWLQLPAGTFIGGGLIHLHGWLFTAWMLLLLGQSWLAARGNLRHHRAWGMAGIALASAMVCVGTLVAVISMKLHLDQGHGDRARQFLIVPLMSMVTFPAFFALAIANARDTAAHRRYLFVATASLLGAAIARVFFLAFNGMGPGLRPGLTAPLTVTQTLGPVMMSNLVIVAGMVHDWRVHGRPHRAWWVGLSTLLTIELLRTPIAASAVWLHFADWLAHLA